MTHWYTLTIQSKTVFGDTVVEILTVNVLAMSS